MSKRIFALLLCLLMVLPVITGCSAKKDADDKGAYITMYLTNQVYNFDPAYAYQNEEAESLVSLLFARLFTLDSKGKVKGDLVKSYKTKIDEKNQEYTMEITLRDAWWSDKTQISANDVVDTWQRILDPENSFECAALLFDIKNARAVKADHCSIDDLGACALSDTILQISFEKPINYDDFILNLTSLALAPIRKDYFSKSEDWAKKPGTMVTSGPYKISKTVISEKSGLYADAHAMQENGEYTRIDGSSLPKYNKATYDMLVLERNNCYNRDPNEDYALDKSVKPYRIIVDFTKSEEEIWESFLDGQTIDSEEKAAINDILSTKKQIKALNKEIEKTKDKDGSLTEEKNELNKHFTEITSSGILDDEIFFMGSIPLALRTDADVMKKAKIQDALSTQVIYFNEDAVLVNKNTSKEVKLFADPEIRRALSIAIDREAIAEGLVLASPATALVPNGLFNKGTSGSFRKVGGNILETSANIDEAKNILKAAGIKASEFAFNIVVNANNDGLVYTAEAIAEVWNELGFKVKVTERGTIVNNDWYAPTKSTPKDVCDDLFAENYHYRDFEVLLTDVCAYSADPYSMLAPFAADFSGNVDENNDMTTHVTGYNNEEYNDIFEAIFYLNYYEQITANDYAGFYGYDSKEDFQAVLDKVKAVYEKYDISTTKDLAAGRSKLLHEAETILMEDLPVLPIVFNKTATITGKNISGVKSNCYYTSYFFAGTKLKKYQNYVDSFDYLYGSMKTKLN